MLTEIARELKLSRATVSMCLSGQAARYRIKPATIERVRAHADRVGYVPNRMARGLSSKGEPPVGLLLHNDSDEKRLDAFRLAARKLGQLGRNYVVQNFSDGRMAEAVGLLKGFGVRDVLCITAIDVNRFPKHENIRRLLNITRDMELHCLDFYFPAPPCPWWPERFHRYGIDRQAVYLELFGRLRAAGTEKLITETLCAGYAEQSGFTGKRLTILELDLEIADPFEQGRRLVIGLRARARAGRGTCLVVRDDRVAAGAIEALSARGFRIPEDIGVIGFDDIRAAPYFRVPLTTFHLPLPELTERAIDRIVSPAGREARADHPAAVEIVWRASFPRPGGVAPQEENRRIARAFRP